MEQNFTPDNTNENNAQNGIEHSFSGGQNLAKEHSNTSFNVPNNDDMFADFDKKVISDQEKHENNFSNEKMNSNSSQRSQESVFVKKGENNFINHFESPYSDPESEHKKNKRAGIIVTVCLLLIVFGAGIVYAVNRFISPNNVVNNNTYLIVFVYNKGSNEQTSFQCKFGEQIIYPTVTKDGYNFAGWFMDNLDDNGCGDQFTYDTMPDLALNGGTSLTLYAKWVPKVYNIIYLDQYGADFSGELSLGMPETFTYGIPTDLSDPQKDDFTFLGWFLNPNCAGIAVDQLSGTEIAGDVTVYAKWTPNEYLITYLDKGGEDFSGNHAGDYPRSHTYGISTELKSPNKLHYTFDGWFDNPDCEGVKLTRLSAYDYHDQITLYAKWTIDTYSIIYRDKESEEFTGVLEPEAPSGHTYGTATVLKNATKRGCSFDGWFFEPDCSGTPVTELGATEYENNIILYALWVPSVYNISYLDQGGNELSGEHLSGYPTTHTYGTDTTLAIALKSGYVFKGWFNNPECSGKKLTVLGAEDYIKNITLYAKWELEVFTLSGNTITGLTDYGRTLTTLDIPLEINETVVVKVGNNAFKSNPILASVTIEEGVLYVGASAFSDCNSLEYIVIPTSLISFQTDSLDNAMIIYYLGTEEQWALVGNRNANWFVATYCETEPVENKTTKWHYVNDLPTLWEIPEMFELYSNVLNLTNYGRALKQDMVIPSTYNETEVNAIAQNGFKYAKLTSVTVPNTISSMEASAFSTCKNLQKVYIDDVRAWCVINFANGESNPLGNGADLYVLGEKFVYPVIPNNNDSEIKNYAFYGCTSIKNVIISDNITRVGDGAFQNCSDLTGVILSDTVVSVGSHAFSGSTNLNSITIPNTLTSIGDNPFYNCTQLSSVYISDLTKWCSINFANGNQNPMLYSADLYVKRPDSATEYDKVVNLVIPETIAEIGAYQFYYCKSIASVQIHDDVTSIGERAFNGCIALNAISISENVTSIGSYAFSNCTALGNALIIGDNTTIGSRAFNGCVALTTLEIRGSVDSIGAYAFNQCNNLTTLKLLCSVNSIGTYAFNECSNLTSITISNSIGTINEHAFYYCTKYKNVYISDLAQWCNITFKDIVANPLYHAGGDLYLWDAVNEEYSKVENLEIPSNVVNVKNYTFYNCKSLKALTISEGITSVGKYAFSQCSGLTQAIIPSTMATMYEYAFQSCGQLKKVYIANLANWCKITFTTTADANPLNSGADLYVWDSIGGDYLKLVSLNIPTSGVSSIKNYAFYNCKSITELTIASGVSSIGNYAFYGCSYLVPVSIAGIVSSIGQYAFAGCSRINTLNITSTLNTIDTCAFLNCSSLSSLSLPTNVSIVNADAFSGCNNLGSVYITDLTQWCKIAFGNASSNPLRFGADLYLNNSKITSLYIPSSGISQIKDYAFYGYNIQNVTIPSNISSISTTAFAECSNLTEVYAQSFTTATMISRLRSSLIPYAEVICSNGTIVTSIYYEYIVSGNSKQRAARTYSGSGSVVSWASNVTNVNFPDTGAASTNINSYAFYGCNGLVNITIPSVITSIGTDAFKGCSVLQNVRISDLTAWCKLSLANEYSNPLCNGSDLFLNGIKVETLNVPTSGISSLSAYAFYNCESLRNVVIGGSVNSIGSFAFYSCDNLESVTITSNLNAIGSKAFYGCTNLNKVDVITFGIWCNINFNTDAYSNPLSYGADLYVNGTKQTAITIPETGISRIKEYTFYNCSSLTSVIIPTNSTVSSISEYAFYSCDNLQNVTIGGNVASIANNAFKNCSGLNTVIISSNLTTIGANSFNGCSQLANVTLPDSITTINESAFENCESIQIVNISDLNKWCNITFVNAYSNPLFNGSDLYLSGVKLTSLDLSSLTGTQIKKYAFYGCQSIISVSIPEGIIKVCSEAFNHCANLVNVSLPGTLITIESNAFANCSAINRVNVADISNWCGVTFENAYANPISNGADLYSGGTKITDLVIASTAPIINDYAFNNCKSIATVTLSKGINVIGSYAFNNCINLTSIEIPGSVTSIGDYAFNGCTLLSTASIPYNLESLGSFAFNNCSSLSEITIPTRVTLINSNTFAGCDHLTKVTINSASIANDLTSHTAQQYLIANATTIYIKANLTVSSSSYLLENFHTETSDKSGYVKYVINT